MLVIPSILVISQKKSYDFSLKKHKFLWNPYQIPSSPHTRSCRYHLSWFISPRNRAHGRYINIYSFTIVKLNSRTTGGHQLVWSHHWNTKKSHQFPSNQHETPQKHLKNHHQNPLSHHYCKSPWKIPLQPPKNPPPYSPETPSRPGHAPPPASLARPSPLAAAPRPRTADSARAAERTACERWNLGFLGKQTVTLTCEFFTYQVVCIYNTYMIN